MDVATDISVDWEVFRETKPDRFVEATVEREVPAEVVAEPVEERFVDWLAEV